MAIESIKDTLPSLGYLIIPYGDKYIHVVRKMSDDDPWIVEMEDYFCRVYFEEGKFRVAEFTSQIPDDKYFDSESEVIAYVKNKFPL